MVNKFAEAMDRVSNMGYTTNGAATYRSTESALMDMFAMGGAYRQRAEADCILLFSKAFAEDPTRALKCLFYLGDIRKGQGERRYFRVCMNWLAKNHTEAARRNMEHIPTFRRWDDLYCFVDTPPV